MGDEGVIHDQGSHPRERIHRFCATRPQRVEVCDDAPVETGMDDAAIDFAIAAVREESLWQVSTLPPRAGSDLESFLHALRQQPGEIGTIGFVSSPRTSSSRPACTARRSASCSPTSPACRTGRSPRRCSSASDCTSPKGVELEESTPAGDLEIFADLGLPSMELAMLCEDLDLYPDEQIGTIATRLGFGEQYESTVDANLG